MRVNLLIDKPCHIAWLGHKAVALWVLDRLYKIRGMEVTCFRRRNDTPAVFDSIMAQVTTKWPMTKWHWLPAATEVPDGIPEILRWMRSTVSQYSGIITIVDAAFPFVDTRHLQSCFETVRSGGAPASLTVSTGKLAIVHNEGRYNFVDVDLACRAAVVYDSGRIDEGAYAFSREPITQMEAIDVSTDDGMTLAKIVAPSLGS